MRIGLFFFALALTVGARLGYAAQHEGHQTSSTTVDAAQVAQCSQAQGVVNGLVEAALKRLESARLTNNAAAMRDAVDDLQGTLVDIKQQLAPCGQLAASTAAAGHAGHATPDVPQAPAATPRTPVTQPVSPTPAPRAVAPRAAVPGAADPHAGHAASPAPRPATPRAAPPAARAKPVAPAAHDAHVMPAAPAGSPAAAAARTELKPAPPMEIANLRCRTPVDPKTAPRMLHRGRMYYFCSEQERSAFAKDPSKYELPAGAAAPAHAH